VRVRQALQVRVQPEFSQEDVRQGASAGAGAGDAAGGTRHG